MFTDTFDKITWLLLAVVIAALAGVLATNHGAGAGRAAGLGKAVEREMAYRARVELLARLYGLVEELRTAGNDQEALLRLNELIRSYPGEAHGYILRGRSSGRWGHWTRPWLPLRKESGSMAITWTHGAPCHGAAPSRAWWPRGWRASAAGQPPTPATGAWRRPCARSTT